MEVTGPTRSARTWFDMPSGGLPSTARSLLGVHSRQGPHRSTATIYRFSVFATTSTGTRSGLVESAGPRRIGRHRLPHGPTAGSGPASDDRLVAFPRSRTGGRGPARRRLEENVTGPTRQITSFQGGGDPKQKGQLVETDPDRASRGYRAERRLQLYLPFGSSAHAVRFRPRLCGNSRPECPKMWRARCV